MTATESRRQNLVFAGIAFVAILATAILQCAGQGGLFAPFFGRLQPVLGEASTVLVGWCALQVLRLPGFEIAPRGNTARGILVAIAAATVLAIIVIAVDYGTTIPVRNVPLPQALLFYPAISLVAETAFHLLPLAGLFALAGLGRGWWYSNPLSWICIVAVSLPEPAFQALVGPRMEAWLAGFVALQVWMVNIVQLVIFRRFGFVPMLALRLTYYAYWHILWNCLRLVL